VCRFRAVWQTRLRYTRGQSPPRRAQPDPALRRAGIFAVRTLLSWYRTGKDPAREMIKLTTYLGHADPAHTYWYLEAVPELLALASRRVEEGGYDRGDTRGSGPAVFH
jgi:hypothetical protein